MIRSIGHVALRVPDLDAAVAHATQILGLREVERSDGSAYLGCRDLHHELELIQGEVLALDHVGLEARGGEGLRRLRESLERAGVPLDPEPPAEAGLGPAIRFAGPGGHVFEVYERMERVDPGYATSGVRPARLQHVTLRTSDVAGTERFLIDVLGFRLSDRAGEAISWLRCNPDHHGVALIGGGGDGLHHYAFEVESWAELERLADRLLASGRRLMFGPGRHGPGLNLFCYHVDGAGALCEYSADLLRIYDDDAYEPGAWPDAPETINQWGPPPPAEFLAHETPNARRR